MERSNGPDRPLIGLVGHGRWGANILRDLLDLGCSVAVATQGESSRERARAGGATTVTGLDELPEVEGIVVATPTSSHGEVLETVLDRNVPLFVEKPLVMDPEHAESLARRAATRLFVMDKWRYHPGIEALGEIARSGELGRTVGLRTSRLGWGNAHADVDPVWTLAPHDLAIALEILGSVPPPRAAVGDVVDGKMTGLVGLLGEGPTHVLEVSVRAPERRREIVARFEDGIASLPDGYADHIAVSHGIPDEDVEPDPERRPVSTELPLLRELRAFVDHLRGGPPPRSSAAEGADAVAAIAELRSLAGGPGGSG